MVVLDTSIIIDHIRQAPGKSTWLLRLAGRYDKSRLGISVISIQELFAGKSTATMKGIFVLQESIAPLPILTYSYEVAQLAGTLIRDGFMQKGFADAAIAATSCINNAQLATLNQKDFRDIPGLQLVDLAALDA